MKVVPALNPLNGQRKSRIAWNALMACYTFRRLGVAQQEAVLASVRSVASQVTCDTLSELLQRRGTIVFLNFLAAGLAKEGYWPALGNKPWYPITNPLVECFGAESALPDMRRELARIYGTAFDMRFDDFAPGAPLSNPEPPNVRVDQCGAASATKPCGTSA